MALWRLYYHLVWATKERQPLIAPDREFRLYKYIIGKASAVGCIVYAVGGTENHIHLVTSIPPSVSIADFVQNIKGSSAYHFNHSLQKSDRSFSWQRGYGVFSLGYRQLTIATNYVKNQKAHHSQGTIVASLEQESIADDPPKNENSA